MPNFNVLFFLGFSFLFLFLLQDVSVSAFMTIFCSMIAKVVNATFRLSILLGYYSVVYSNILDFVF